MARARSRHGPGVIDTHVHWWPRECRALLDQTGASPGTRPDRLAAGATAPASEAGAGTPPDATGADALLALMKRRRVDACLLVLAHPAASAAAPEPGLKLARAWNDACSALHLARPDRFIGAIELPLQAPELAARELRRAARLPGMRAVCLGTHVNGRNLDEEFFWPVFAGCETLSLPVVLHPRQPLSPERMSRHFVADVCGLPYETGLAAASLVLGGVLDAFPALRVLLPQAGGAFPWLAGRLNRARESHRELRQLKHQPSTYLRRFYYDTGSHEPRVLRFLIDLAGADRVLVGSDCVPELRQGRPAAIVEKIPGLTRQEHERILAGSARRLFRL
ncbi:MAG: amidohydrolase [Burkholderiales bacterium]|nr:amidohydrolase [Burkholderiales bacterium]